MTTTVVVAVPIPGSVLIFSTIGVTFGMLSAFDDVDNCSAKPLGVESVLLLALGVPSGVASDGLAC